MTGIKICGIDRAEALEAAIAARASHVGLVYYPPSPRFLKSAKAATLASQAKGVATGLDAIQLHGEETPARVAEVKARFGLDVWKVLPVATADDIARSEAYHGAADFLLFDAKTPKGALPGGMGLRFDWSLLRGYRGPTAWGLAGGLNPGNVADAIARTAAPLVDASSGLESAAGVKDVAKIAAFCDAAHRA